jgi:hypothetical protein
MVPQNNVLLILFWLHFQCFCWTHKLKSTTFQDVVQVILVETDVSKESTTFIFSVHKTTTQKTVTSTSTKAHGQKLKCSAIKTYLYLCKVKYNKSCTVYAKFF